MILTPKELVEIVRGLSDPPQTRVAEKGLRSSINRAIVTMLAVSQNPALKDRAREQMAALEYAAKELERAAKGGE